MVHGLSQENFMDSELEGFWTGALIRSNSVQVIQMEVVREHDTLRALTTIPEWIYYNPTSSVIDIEANVISFGSPYGEMTMVIDSAYEEMVGSCNFAQVHLKRSLRPPKYPKDALSYNVPLDGFSTMINVMKPPGAGPFPTVVLVHGRGCGSKDAWARRPEVLLQYGIATATYDKRGASGTGVSCLETNIDQHAKDLAALTKFLKQQDFVGDLGYIGYSAGGWVAPQGRGVDDRLSLLPNHRRRSIDQHTTTTARLCPLLRT